ncbi:ATP-dependent helicase HrpB [Haematospirillum sp. H1815]|uniref:ATP-dependent helicase HrpB n=1 Tax=Haematospirillum sp. H1815 TaxID=2723108 RepID=UPI00143B1A2B|nr:ATP-dependent helicase HrpB [Haematospirillum sp. H1815]NKD77194.1 ATP-dependent helicase HrpB [Haematospirillum sp. H1815]
MKTPVPDTVFAHLPVSAVIPDLRAALEKTGRVVLQAPPGAGKTTSVPLALLNEPWLADKKIIMLEPRRLAARASAARMAAMLGEKAGETVGFRIRQNRCVSSHTRIEVVTEGILTRMILEDPGLTGVGLVIFDEFHERSLQADLGLALCLDISEALREDLRLLVMSATLDSAPLSSLLGKAPIITSEGRTFPVSTRFLPPRRGISTEHACAEAIQTLVEEEQGSILAFLPGEKEIRRTAHILLSAGLPGHIDVHPLYGAMPPHEQDRALAPAGTGRRKIVLATSVAETSLTIDGIHIVVDSGLSRRSRFDVGSGMGHLVTTRVSTAEAAQRQGRAGRLGPGLGCRLWSEAEDRALAPFPPPEITEADLTPLRLDLAVWGARAEQLRWLAAPPAPALARAEDLLQAMGALDQDGRITQHGKAMAALPLHPRLSHMVLSAQSLGLGGLACTIAAVLAERDPARACRNADLRHRLELVQGKAKDASVDHRALSRIRDLSSGWQKKLGLQEETGTTKSGLVAALAFPDRIGKQRAQGTYTLSGGRSAALPPDDPLAVHDFLVVMDLDGQGANGRIFLAAPLERQDLESLFADSIEEQTITCWDPRTGSVLSRVQQRLGALVLGEKVNNALDSHTAALVMAEGIRQTGLHCLPWDKQSQQFRARVTFLAQQDKDNWPDMTDAGLLDSLSDWFVPFANGLTRLEHLKRLDLLSALTAMLSWTQRQQLERAAPSHFTVPTGERIPLDYTSGEIPVLSVRIQQLFGCRTHPSTGESMIPLTVHLLSPAGRPLQITRDLPGFWTGSYPAIRAEMRGRYPRHPWPDDPLTATPTNRAKPRGNT